MSTVERPLRRDAERNRRRILDAARELFAERGLDATLNDVAHHAGVGVGTVYRRFPDKAHLIDALFEERLQELIGWAEQAAEDADPWRGLTGFLERALALQSTDRAMKEILLGSSERAERVDKVRAGILPPISRVVQRAQEAGQLRAGIVPEDMPVIQMMIGAIIDAARGIAPELWRRYLEIVLTGIRANPPAGAALAPPALSVERTRRMMEAWRPQR